jgi:NADH dehydrogenase
MWLFVHLTFLTGFKNRVSVLANWGVAFLGRGRAERTITLRQALGRTRGPRRRKGRRALARSSVTSRR